jgi:tetratricopeptide (TPR) repeat protein
MARCKSLAVNTVMLAGSWCCWTMLFAASTRAQQPADANALAAVPQVEQPVPQTAPGPTATEAAQQARIATLIELLGDASYHQRESAKWELERIGLAAFEQLRQAAHTHPRAHIALAARYLIDSQDVVWWVESDSLDVRDLLTTYNDSSPDDRDTALQQLAERGTPDALLALCRLARFESSELRSKSAALYLMQAITTQLAREALGRPALLTAQWPASIQLTLGDSQRMAIQWLRSLMVDLSRLPGTTNAASTPDSNGKLGQLQLDNWHQLIAKEHAEAIAQLPSAGGADESMVYGGEQLEHFRSVAVTLRFYRWLGLWVTQHHGRQAALDMVRPSLKLVGQDPHALQSAASWVLEADLPELVVELAASYPEPFAGAPELGYFLAEGHMRLGDDQAAQLAADNASNSILKMLNTNLRNFRDLDLEDIQANRHFQLAEALSDRGLFQWAEHEYARALKFESRIAPDIRVKFAEFYWAANQHQKAAEILKPLADEALNNRDLELPTAPGVFNNPGAILASYYFYEGLAAKDRGDHWQASELLRKNLDLEIGFPNPDAVIAMKQLATQEPFTSYYQSHFDKMSKSFRVRVIQAEEQLTRSVDRMSRAMAGPNVASECNQLAWLLSKCEVNPEEAINLSLRSLELAPDEPAYLDTLARCYFSAGNIEKAVLVQKRAVRLKPHERQMAAQLTEFESALQSDRNPQ